MRMRLFDRQERVRERAPDAARDARRAGPPGARRSHARPIHVPERHQGHRLPRLGTARTATTERFLYLPSLGRVRRIAGSEAQESFVGSDLTYEDIGGREFDDYTYRLLDDPNASGPRRTARRTRSTRSSRGAATPTRAFPRVVSLVRQDNFVIVRAEIHNRRDEVQKTFDALRVERVNGYWTTMEMRMTDALQRTRTELVVEKVGYNVGLKPDDFSRRELERGSGR